ncbi:hypothetical protein BU15DRAFT_75441 [Melanogaster broomeanus]|nr:hypothetical protein BU15DRAFT_75441 [Melanogaster broomeanus]
MNVNLDVLELIFAHLGGSDLVSSSLVSHSFLAGVIPSLYSRIEYTSKHAKRYSAIMSPFTTLSTHKHLSRHVKLIAVYSVPVLQSSSQVNPAFLQDLAQAIKILPALLPHLKDKPRLQHLRVCAQLGHRQMDVLQEIGGLQSLSLDFPTWNVIDAMPKWVGAMQKTLAHLTIFVRASAILQTTKLIAVVDVTRHQCVCAEQHISATPLPSWSPRYRMPEDNAHCRSQSSLHTPDLRELSLTIFVSCLFCFRDPQFKASISLLKKPHYPSSLTPCHFLPTCPSTSVHHIQPCNLSSPASISRLAPRDALAICGAWIGEIKGESERSGADGEGDDPGGGVGGPMAPFGPFGPNLHVVHGHVQMQGPGHGQGQGNEQPPLPLLTTPGPVGPNQNPNIRPESTTRQP